MVVKELGRVIDSRLEQSRNPEDPMVVKELGRVTEVKPLQPENALTWMTVKLVKYCSSSKEVISVLPWNTVPKEVTAAASG